MGTAKRFVGRHPLAAFFVLAYALTWWVYPLLRVSPLLGLPGLLGPALAAVVVAAVAEGRVGLKHLLGRVLRCRVGARWYALALGLPAALALGAAGLHPLLGPAGPARLGSPSALDAAVFVLVVGEELGWRGYALPRLLASRSAVSASVILGVFWGAWHLPAFFVAGAPQYGLPFPAFLPLTVAYSVLFTWIFVRTGGSVLIATLLHGAVNFSQGFFLGGVDPARGYWLLAAVYGATALVLVLSDGPKLARGGRAEVPPRSS